MRSEFGSIPMEAWKLSDNQSCSEEGGARGDHVEVLNVLIRSCTISFGFGNKFSQPKEILQSRIRENHTK